MRARFGLPKPLAPRESIVSARATEQSGSCPRPGLCHEVARFAGAPPPPFLFVPAPWRGFPFGPASENYLFRMLTSQFSSATLDALELSSAKVVPWRGW